MFRVENVYLMFSDAINLKQGKQTYKVSRAV